MTVALLGIGTELTRGDLANTNGTWLAQELTALGFEVTAIEVVDDERTRIVATLERLSQTHELVICTGGLGPTTDDLTTACAATLLGVALAFDPPSLTAIEARFVRLGREMTESNRKQAYFPSGATILANDWGTAPGFAIEHGKAKLFFTPGVPQEMRPMFAERIVPLLSIPQERTPHEVVLRTFGLGESAINDTLNGIESEFDVTVGYRIRFPEVDVKVLVRDVDSTKALDRAEQAKAAIFSRLGSYVYGEGPVTLPIVIGQTLTRLNRKLAVAESCTGGLLSSIITEQSGVSGWFLGGVVSYANEVKTAILQVQPELLVKHGAVSEAVARAMAEGVAAATGADYALAITGVAGPEGGSDDKPVGTVCFALRTPLGQVSCRKQLTGERVRIQRLSAYHALKLLLDDLASTS